MNQPMVGSVWPFLLESLRVFFCRSHDWLCGKAAAPTTDRLDGCGALRAFVHVTSVLVA